MYVLIFVFFYWLVFLLGGLLNQYCVCACAQLLSHFYMHYWGWKGLWDWYRATITKHIWSSLMQAGSLWVAWIHKYLLNGKIFWDVKPPRIALRDGEKFWSLGNLWEDFLINRKLEMGVGLIYGMIIGIHKGSLVTDLILE